MTGPVAGGSAAASAPRCWSTWPPLRWRWSARGCPRPSRRTPRGCTARAGRRRGTPRRGRSGTPPCRSHGPGLDLVLREAPHGVAELEQLVGESSKLHGRRLPDAPARYFLILDPRPTRSCTSRPTATRAPPSPRPVTGRPAGRAPQAAEEGAEAPAPLAAAHALRPLLRRPDRRPRRRGPLRLRPLPLRPDQEDPRQAPGGRVTARQALQPPPGGFGLPGLRVECHPGQRVRQRGQRGRPAQRRDDGGALRPGRQDRDRAVDPTRTSGSTSRATRAGSRA